MDRKSNISWLGAVFGLLFFAAGVAAAYGSAGKMIIGYIASSDWVEVPATIHDVDLVSNYNDDSTTYKVTGTYSFNFDGVSYHSNRVRLSTGSDNVGKYWQNLERTLRALQRNNEASAIVNPQDPTQSLLDRTLRWKSIIFGSLFLILFGGIGGFIMWASLRGTKSREARLLDEQGAGIISDQKTGSWFLAAFGGVFFVIGAGMSLIVLPDAIRAGQYGALFILAFVIVGVGFIYHAFKLYWAYRRFGPTPLFLDPSVPGVGGQLGGQFNLNVAGIGHKADSATQLQARLACVRKSKSRDNTSYKVEWQEDAPVYLKETATGINASFLFEIPDSCIPTKEQSKRSSIDWNVTVEGELGATDLGKFERSWKIVVEERAAQASHGLSIPQSFIDRAKQKTDDRAETSALNQVSVSEDAQTINVHSKAGRNLAGKMIGMLFGAIFLGMGIFTTMQSWWPGYLFIVLGGIAVLFSLYIIGKSITVKIDKQSRMLNTRESWFGLVYASHQADVLDRDQFKIKKTSSSSTHNNVTEYYAVNFKDNGKKIRIADGIEGKKEALALKNAITDRCFNQ